MYTERCLAPASQWRLIRCGVEEENSYVRMLTAACYINNCLQPAVLINVLGLLKTLTILGDESVKKQPSEEVCVWSTAAWRMPSVCSDSAHGAKVKRNMFVSSPAPCNRLACASIHASVHTLNLHMLTVSKRRTWWRPVFIYQVLCVYRFTHYPQTHRLIYEFTPIVTCLSFSKSNSRRLHFPPTPTIGTSFNSPFTRLDIRRASAFRPLAVGFMRWGCPLFQTFLM